MSRAEDKPMCRVARRWLRSGGLLGAVLMVTGLLLVAAPAPVQAHTDLVGSTPRAGDTVAFTTDRLVLVFGDELAESGQVAVRDADDVDVVSGRGTVTGDTFEVPLELRRAGRHVVTYRVAAGDGHVVVGEFSFVVAKARPAGRVDTESEASTTPGRSTPDLPTSAPAPAVAPEPESSAVTPAWWLVAMAAAAGAGVLLHRVLSRGSGKAIPPRG